MSILRINDAGKFFKPNFLHDLIQGNNAKIFRILNNENNPWQLSDSQGRTLLHFATEYGNDELARHLIDMGADVNAQNQMKETPLMFALESLDATNFEMLLEAGADIFVPNSEGQCILGIAFRKMSWIHKRIYMAVLSKVTVESLKDSVYVASEVFHRDCPLHFFMQLNDANVTRFLLERGSLVNARTPHSEQTALHLAVKFNCLENVQLLLEYGAHVEVQDKSGQIPLLCVENSRWDEQTTPAIMKLLIDQGTALVNPISRKSVIEKLFTYGNRGVIRTLLQYPIDLQFQFAAHDFTSLYYLSYNRNPNVFEELRQFGFDVNLRDKAKLTLLHHTATIGNASSVKFLLDRGADVNAQDICKKTPLFTIIDPYMAAMHIQRYGDYVQCVEILLDYGADPQLYTGKDDPSEYGHISDKLITPVFAKLALFEASGRPINTFTRNCIESQQRLKSAFDAVKSQLEQMKQIKIVDLVTLFDFIITGKISRLATNKCFVANVTDVMKNCSVVPYYHRMLQRRFSKLNQLIELRETLLPVINEVLIKYCNLSLYNVAERIMDCFQDEQWKEIL